LIIFDSVSKGFGETKALTDFNLTVEKGSATALLGHNGAGKSTALNILLGQIAQDAGEVSIEGLPLHRARAFVGGLAQVTGFPFNIKVGELVEFVKAHYKNGPSSAELAKVFDLDSIWGRYATELSGGQARRLGVAIALAGEHRYLVLDEPTTGLDPLSRRHLWSVFKTFNTLGGTLLFTTHDIVEAEELATDVAVLAQGKLLAKGPVQAMKSLYCKDVVLFKLKQTYDFPLDLDVHVGRDQITITGDADSIVRKLVEYNVPFEGLAVERASMEALYGSSHL